MTTKIDPNGTLAVIWRYTALTLLSVTLAFGAWFGKSVNDRVTKLEELQIARAAMLAEINTKLNLLLAAHNIHLSDNR